jgi:hypothetical protein
MALQIGSSQIAVSSPHMPVAGVEGQGRFVNQVVTRKLACGFVFWIIIDSDRLSIVPGPVLKQKLHHLLIAAPSGEQ